MFQSFGAGIKPGLTEKLAVLDPEAGPRPVLRNKNLEVSFVINKKTVYSLPNK